MTKTVEAGLLNAVLDDVLGPMKSLKVVKFVGCKLHVNVGVQVVGESMCLKSFHKVANER